MPSFQGIIVMQIIFNLKLKLIYVVYVGERWFFLSWEKIVTYKNLVWR